MRVRIWLGTLGVLMMLGLTACGEPPKVLPQGTAEQQAEDVRSATRRVVTALGAGQTRQMIEQGAIFQPLRWRKQAKAHEELDALSAALKGREGIELGEVTIAGRWALIDGVSVGGERVGPADVPWFMLYYSGRWSWVPSSILKDPAVEGMMDRKFDRLYGEWQAKQGR